MSEIFVHGVSGEVLAPACVRQLASCKAVVVSRRFSSLLPEHELRRIAIAPVDRMLDRVADTLATGDVVILASGDPLFFGIGRRLLEHFGPERISFFPAVTAVQLACARFKVPWEDVVIRSLHGRAVQNLAALILPHNKVMLFTDHHNSPENIAGDLLKTLRQYGDNNRADRIRVRVAENLGMDDEKVTVGSLADIAAARFSPLNMMLVEQEPPGEELPVFGLREREIAHSRGLITKDEVRAVILHALRLPAGGVFWDVGGGSGSISVEAARLAPQLVVYTIEKKQEGQANIRQNIGRYNRYSIRLIAGEAPEVLVSLPDPDRIFIGGSGGRLAEIINHCAARLRPGGILVASAVLQTTAEQAPILMRAKKLAVTCMRVQVSRQKDCGGKSWQLNPITIIIGKK